jgi:hypothetical protein
MEKNVLLVFNRNKDVLVDEIKSIIQTSVFTDGVQGLIDLETSVAPARERIRLRPYDLLVVDLHVPVDGASIALAEQPTGLDFVAELHETGKGLPSIIVTPRSDDTLSYRASKVPNCRPLALGEAFAGLLVEMCRDVCQGEACEETVSLDLEILVTDNPDQSNRCRFKMFGTIDNESIDREGVLDIDLGKIKDLKARSDQVLPNLPSELWESELKRIGRELFEELFHKNYILTKRFERYRSKIDAERQFRFRFKVGKIFHSVVLEALFEEDEDDENFYWMLKYPICRKIALSGDYNEFFIDRVDVRQRFNCLIIKSDVHEYVDELDASFTKLYNIEREVEFLNRFLSQKKKELRIDTIRLLEEPEPGLTFSETLRKVLSEEKYHLVHYAGHSYYDANAKKGYLPLPGKDYPEVVDIEELSVWLRKAKTQFIFLSSCHSSEEDFVFELASKKIPAILGFRWDMDDAMAFEYAECFYTHLFKNANSLEYALLKARKEMHANYPQDRIWAAPMLVLQTRR